MSTYFYDLPTTAKRRNTYIHPTQKAGSLRIYSLPELIERNGLNSTAGAFVYPSELVLFVVRDACRADATGEADSELVPLTTYVVADFDSEKGREFVKEAIKSVVSASRSLMLSSVIDSGLVDPWFTQPSVIHPFPVISDPHPLRPFFYPRAVDHRGRAVQDLS